MEQLFLCFYGDGPLWDNIFKIPAYPNGYSYPRQFRYTDKWIHKKVLEIISDNEKRLELIGSEVNLCIRFHTDTHKWDMLPIRKAFITHIDFLPDEHSIYFSLGDFYNYSEYSSCKEACITIPEDYRDEIEDKLFFFSSNLVKDDQFVNLELSDSMWIYYSDVISKDLEFPIKEEARKSIFLRFKTPSKKRPAKIEKVHQAWHSEDIYGCTIYEGESYELVYYHRIPYLIGTKDSIDKTIFEYLTPSGNIELNRSSEEITGNYQKHVINLTALRPSGTFEEILISPFEEITKSQKTVEQITTFTLQIPIKVNPSFYYRFKNTYIWIILLWISLFITTILKVFIKDTSDISQIIVFGVVTVFSAVMVWILQQKGSKK